MFKFKRTGTQPRKFKNCVVCAPEDFKLLGSTARVNINGKPKLFKVIPDLTCKPGSVHVMYKGRYRGSYSVSSKLAGQSGVEPETVPLTAERSTN